MIVASKMPPSKLPIAMPAIAPPDKESSEDEDAVCWPDETVTVEVTTPECAVV